MKKFSSKQMISLALALFGLSAMIWLGATRFYAADAKNVVGNLSYTGDLLPNSPRSMQFIHSETLDPKIPTGNPLDSNNGDTALYQWISGQSTLYLLPMEKPGESNTEFRYHVYQYQSAAIALEAEKLVHQQFIAQGGTQWNNGHTNSFQISMGDIEFDLDGKHQKVPLTMTVYAKAQGKELRILEATGTGSQGMLTAFQNILKKLDS